MFHPPVRRAVLFWRWRHFREIWWRACSGCSNLREPLQPAARRARTFFPRRLQKLLIEEVDALGQVCHYIHLNPVRAKLVPMDKLATYRSGSYWFLKQLTRRPDCLEVETALQAAGGLSDSRAGRRCYEKYLNWQATDGPAGRTKAYVNPNRGWALGSQEFKLALVRDHYVPPEVRAWEKSGAREVNELQSGEQLKRSLVALDKTPADATRARKSAA